MSLHDAVELKTGEYERVHWYPGKSLGVVAISRELNGLGITPRKAKRWKGNTIYKLIQNPLYAGFIRSTPT